jgi:Uma2 family endonuclease
MVVKAIPPQIETLVTGEELLAMGDIGPSELVEGRIVPMSPTSHKHGIYEGNFHEFLKAFVRQHNLGKVMVGKVGIYIRRNPDTVRGADVVFISNERYAEQKKEGGFLEVAPDLVVEIMSPDDRWSEVTQKLREYFSIGVRLVWVADPEVRTVYAYRSLTDVREFTEADTLPADDVLPGFSVPVASLLEE